MAHDRRRPPGDGGGAEAAGSADSEFGYRGRRLGLPESGPRSIPGFGRRIGAIFIDWLLAVAAAQLVPLDHPLLPLGVFALVAVVSISLTGTTIGKRLLGVHLAPVGDGPPWAVRVLLRTLLICLVVPPLVWDRDGRGLHDLAARTVSLRL
ncbi:RDD family protein [Allonocardiopsis opalescens]|uniref:RDD domain-containing protein n=1 Tax=Allonocardiopsis opalescens TaxID=1144618 RepID=A0A2T0PZY1_9ACTN|nr:RDD family protein [Allonocardiopsis opalescens]PRX97112.1 hypothetical protein CLV72_106148 [Allonocardiopsis opalescens]